MMKLLALVAVSFAATQSFAANLINEDGKKYPIHLSCDGAITHTSINPRSIQEDAFREGCVISIGKKKAKSLTVKSASDVVIRKGKLVGA